MRNRKKMLVEPVEFRPDGFLVSVTSNWVFLNSRDDLEETSLNARIGLMSAANEAKKTPSKARSANQGSSSRSRDPLLKSPGAHHVEITLPAH
jgi:hypothetical protein